MRSIKRTARTPPGSKAASASCAVSYASNCTRRDTRISFRFCGRELALVQIHGSFRTCGSVRIMRDHDDGLALLAVECLQQAQDFITRFAIQVAGRLVTQQNGWVGDNGSGDANTLLFASGKRARKMFGTMSQS